MADGSEQKTPEATGVDEAMADAAPASTLADEGGATAADAQVRELQDRLLRTQAELDNFRKRSRRELEDERRYANMPLLRDLLPVVDNIGRAIDAATKNSDASSLLEGFRMVSQQLNSILERHHTRPIKALNESFDPHLHEAILQQPSEEVPPGTVLMVTQEGYQLHDRVVRPAQVIVSKQPD